MSTTLPPYDARGCRTGPSAGEPRERAATAQSGVSAARGRAGAAERRPPVPAGAAGEGWSDYLHRLSSRRFQAFLVGVLTPIAAMVSGNLDARAGVVAVIAAVIAWLASEGAVDAAAGRTAGRGG